MMKLFLSHLHLLHECRLLMFIIIDCTISSNFADINNKYWYPLLNLETGSSEFLPFSVIKI